MLISCLFSEQCSPVLPELPLMLPEGSAPLLPGEMNHQSKDFAHEGRFLLVMIIRRGGDGLPAPGDNLPFSINNRSFSSAYENVYDVGHIIQVQADLLLHHLLWLRPDHPLLCHEAPAAQEVEATYYDALQVVKCDASLSL